jgi:hypothetical protein
MRVSGPRTLRPVFRSSIGDTPEQVGILHYQPMPVDRDIAAEAALNRLEPVECA